MFPKSELKWGLILRNQSRLATQSKLAQLGGCLGSTAAQKSQCICTSITYTSVSGVSSIFSLRSHTDLSSGAVKSNIGHLEGVSALDGF